MSRFPFSQRFLIVLAGIAALVPLVLFAWQFVAAKGISNPSAASIPSENFSSMSNAFTYQGLLINEGTPVDGPCDFRASLWDGPGGAAAQIGGTLTRASIPVSGGRFMIPELDFGPNAFNGDERFLQLATRCPAGTGSFTTLAPRQQLTAAPYAAYSLRTPWSGLQGIPPGFADGVDDGATYTAGPGLTLAGGQFAADFDGSGTANTLSHSDHDHYGQNWEGGDFGFRLNATNAYGNGYALAGVAVTRGTGVQGLALEPGYDAGMTVPTAVSGINLLPAGGFADKAFGVYGQANGANTYGVYGNSSNIGVAGINEGTGMGVYGESSNGIGVYGKGTTGSFGLSEINNGTGVIGQANTGSLAFGVWGISSGGYAGYFSGKVNVTGNLTKAGGSFRIDHPLDPANQYLSHSFVESPDMKNIYDGVATLDEAGEATVNLPAYFEALNRDFRYQLTCIGGYAPVFIAREITQNSFVIAGGTPGLKVSWQVTGIRQDPWANDNRIQVEEPKPAEETGTYLYPQGYDQPPTLQKDFVRRQQMQDSQAFAVQMADSQADHIWIQAPGGDKARP